MWDYDRFGANEFLGKLVISDILSDDIFVSGEVRIDLSQAPLDEEAEWHYLTTYRSGLPDGQPPPSHLPSRYTPPHLTSRYSESPGSDFEDGYSLYKDRLEQVS